MLPTLQSRQLLIDFLNVDYEVGHYLETWEAITLNPEKSY